MDWLTTSVYKFLWQLIQYLVSLYEFILWLRLRIIAFGVWSYDLCHTTSEREQNAYDFLKQCKNHLSKIPKHLNIIIGPENSQVNDELFRRIITYALCMNINYISYYDTRYTNTSKIPRLTVLEKLNCPKGWKRKDINSHHSVWYIANDESLNGTKHKNGLKGSKLILENGYQSNRSVPPILDNYCIEIYELQPQNNRPLIAWICQDLFKQRHTTEMQHLLENRTLLEQRLSKELSHHLGNLTEPELSIIFSEDMCIFGMLPWHIRFTEFHRHASGAHFDAKAFAHILYKYSRCEQRWGK